MPGFAIYEGGGGKELFMAKGKVDIFTPVYALELTIFLFLPIV